MRIGELKQIGTKKEVRKRKIPIYDEEILIDTKEEEYEVDIPIMGLVYRDMTEEEIEQNRQIEIDKPITEEDRLEALESALLELIGGIE